MVKFQRVEFFLWTTSLRIIDTLDRSSEKRFSSLCTSPPTFVLSSSKVMKLSTTFYFTVTLHLVGGISLETSLIGRVSKRSWRVGGWLKFFLGGSLKDKARVILMNAVRAILSFFEKKGIEVSHKEVFLLHSFVIEQHTAIK